MKKRTSEKTNKLKLVIGTLAVLVFAILLTGCGDSDLKTDASNDSLLEAVEGETTYPVTVTDDLGYEVVIEKEPERIASLGPAQTEILFALGVKDKIVGRSDIDDYPAEAADIPSVGTYYEPNIELIIGAAPDLVIAANYIEEDARTQLNQAGIQVYACYDAGLYQTENNIIKIGNMLNANDSAAKIVSEMENKRKEIAEICKKAETQKKVFVDLGDFYSAGDGSLLDDMLKEINALNIAAGSGETWPQLSLEKIISENPDVYLSLFESKEEIAKKPGLDAINAVKEDTIYALDPFSQEASMIQRSGPRIIDGLEIMAKLIYPELFE